MTGHEKVADGPILIQGAMAEETDWLVAELERPEEITLGGYAFLRGNCNGCALVIGRTEIGEVNASCATTLGILHFAPVAVINQGLAGAHSEELHIGDVVIGESCTHINDWQTAIRGRREGSDPLSWSESKRQRALPRDPALVSLFGTAPYADGTLTLGRLGSGDLFSREHDRILWLRERCGHLCEDMESIAGNAPSLRVNITMGTTPQSRKRKMRKITQSR